MFPIRDHNPSGRTPYVTYMLMAMNIAVFLSYVGVMDNDRAINAFFFDWALIPALVTDGQGYTGIFTSMFLHGGWMHLAGNMLFLYIFGDNIEDRTRVAAKIQRRAPLAGANVVADQVIGDLFEGRHNVTAAQRKDRIQMHRRTRFGDAEGQHALSRPCLKQGLSQLPNPLWGRPLAHTDQNGAVAHWHNVAALHRRQPVVQGGVAPVDRRLARKFGVKFIDCGVQ